ncbi:hypothetical protein CYMTET_50908 [Cymbomonas tetramitiformis]|uniref:Uncharacterized protein n=1 Tax=Cymbomonas tetramitiformis TaxID=36881 RepID=A0AAE0BM98_9CHLO|nr:hypothetical protein CYMTET_50908 [Cymbomonas tetramitiformis]
MGARPGRMGAEPGRVECEPGRVGASRARGCEPGRVGARARGCSQARGCEAKARGCGQGAWVRPKRRMGASQGACEPGAWVRGQGAWVRARRVGAGRARGVQSRGLSVGTSEDGRVLFWNIVNGAICDEIQAHSKVQQAAVTQSSGAQSMDLARWNASESVLLEVQHAAVTQFSGLGP